MLFCWIDIFTITLYSSFCHSVWINYIQLLLQFFAFDDLSLNNLRKSDKHKTQNNKEPRQVDKPKDHVGNIDLMSWDKQALKSELEVYENNHLINWRELATKYKVCNKEGHIASNGGQIVKGWLVSEGVDLSRFRTKRENSECGTITVWLALKKWHWWRNNLSNWSSHWRTKKEVDVNTRIGREYDWWNYCTKEGKLVQGMGVYILTYSCLSQQLLICSGLLNSALKMGLTCMRSVLAKVN